jgi:hypothetical protein
MAHPERSRRAFSVEEDVLLIHLVATHGTSQWDVIASSMERRTPRQCRERWKSCLSPGHVNAAWTQAEDRRLVELYKVHGPRWAVIAKSFPSRSDYNVKNRWKRFTQMEPAQGKPQGDGQIPFRADNGRVEQNDEIRLEHFDPFTAE